ncbi:hypothetical protein PsorP6_012198 [Peronosclerospora sorghi]|uniref:Uncharacterized protein n=1 Tax=Peronosclerospora sorghi TaxID=230839 RepID=A0ACC0WL58_9STRA|nr:hypothetical protein PsorP6_012198 [Peronosclerospora sorghi]
MISVLERMSTGMAQRTLSKRGTGSPAVSIVLRIAPATTFSITSFTNRLDVRHRSLTLHDCMLHYVVRHVIVVQLYELVDARLIVSTNDTSPPHEEGIAQQTPAQPLNVVFFGE